MPQGIGYTDPQRFELNRLQAGASNASGIVDPMKANTVTAQGSTKGAGASSLDLQEQLNQIKALNASQPSQSGGIGQTIGNLAGTGIGVAVGGADGASIGGAAGGSLGSIVDYMIEGDASEEAERLRIDELEKRKRIALKKRASSEWLESMARSKGIQMGGEQELRDKNTVAKEMRGRLMEDMLGRIAKGSQFNEAMRQKYLKTRSL